MTSIEHFSLYIHSYQQIQVIVNRLKYTKQSARKILKDTLFSFKQNILVDGNRFRCT